VGEASLFVIDMGTAVRDGVVFRDVTRRLSDGGRLARVVIDEAHLTLLWDVRKALAHLRQKLPDLQCPLLLLTATAPPSWIDALLAAVGLRAHRQWSLIRPTSTARTNIRYVVEPVPVRFHRRPAAVARGNAPLHGAVSDRVLAQAASVRSRSGDAAGRTAVLGVFCETVVEINGVVAQLHERLRRTGQHGCNGSSSSSRRRRTPAAGGCGGGGGDGGGVDDVVILKFHSQGAAPEGSTSANHADGEAVAALPTTGTLVDQDQTFNGAFHGPAIKGGSIVLPAPANLARGGSSSRTGGSSRPLSVLVSAVVADALRAPGVGVVIFVGSPAVSTGTDFADMVWALFLGPKHLLGSVEASVRLCRDASTVETAVVRAPDGYAAELDQETTTIPNIVAVGDVVAWAVLPPTGWRR